MRIPEVPSNNGFYVKTMDRKKESYNDPDQLYEIVSLDDSPTGVKAKMLEKNWIEISREEWEEINKNDTRNYDIEEKLVLLKRSDLKITRYAEEVEAVKLGALDKAFLSDEDYKELLKNRNEWRARIAWCKEKLLIKRNFRADND